MISDERSSMSEIRRIIFEDIYHIRQYQEGYFDTIFDIGAHIGVFSLFMRMRHPNAKIIAVEPCRETCKYLRQNLTGLGINIEEIALGDGSQLYFSPREHSHSHRFVSRPNENYAVPSMTLPELFAKYRPTHRYMLKIDCEGGERSLIGDLKAHEILANAKQISIEVHFGYFEDRLSWEEYDEWIRTIPNHSVGYHFSSRKVGVGNYILEKLGRKYRYE